MALPKRKVLVVDNDLMLTKQWFAEISPGLLKNVSVQVCDEGLAFQKIVAIKPHLIFVPAAGPDNDCLAMLDKLKKMPCQSFEVVFTTFDLEQVAKAFQYGAFDCLMKPVDPHEFTKIIMRFIYGDRTKPACQAESCYLSHISHNYMKKKFSTSNGFVYIDPHDIAQLNYSDAKTYITLSNNTTFRVEYGLRAVLNMFQVEFLIKMNRTMGINMFCLQSYDQVHNFCEIKVNDEIIRIDNVSRRAGRDMMRFLKKMEKKD